MIDRRQLLAALTAAAAVPAMAQTTPNPALLRARRLRPGDTVALVSPSGATYERAPYEVAIESLTALGFKVREAPNLRARYGHFGGTDAQRRARDVLRAAMEAEGYTVFDVEWWHFDYRDWREYPILNLSFNQLGPARKP